MGINYCIVAENGGLATIVYQMQNAKRSERQGRLLNHENGPMYGLVRRMFDVLNARS